MIRKKLERHVFKADKTSYICQQILIKELVLSCSNMSWNSSIILLLAFIVFPENVVSNSLGIDQFEELITYVKSLEFKLNYVENKLSIVENQLEVQMDINEKQEKELREQKTLINSLKSSNRKIDEAVEMIGKQNEISDRFLQRITDSDVKETRAKKPSRLLRRDAKQDTKDNKEMSSRFGNIFVYILHILY